MTNKEAIDIINNIQVPVTRHNGKYQARYLVLEAIQKAVEALEVADVVRCKDCKFWDITSPMATVIPVPCRCGLRRDHEATLETDFCSYAVRRENETNG